MIATSPAERPPASPFWNFSLRFYGQPGVPPACIALQEKSGVDVNVLLFCLFAATSHRELIDEDVARIIASIDDWKTNVVVPLRKARVYLRAPAEALNTDAAAALRQRLKALELEAERLQQEALFETFPLAHLGRPGAAASAAAGYNIETLERVLRATFDRQAVAVVLSAFDKLGIDS